MIVQGIEKLDSARVTKQTVGVDGGIDPWNAVVASGTAVGTDSGIGVEIGAGQVRSTNGTTGGRQSGVPAEPRTLV